MQNMDKQNLTNYEEQIEELLNLKENLIDTNNALVKLLNEAKKELKKEKHTKAEF